MADDKDGHDLRGGVMIQGPDPDVVAAFPKALQWMIDNTSCSFDAAIVCGLIARVLVEDRITNNNVPAGQAWADYEESLKEWKVTMLKRSELPSPGLRGPIKVSGSSEN